MPLGQREPAVKRQDRAAAAAGLRSVRARAGGLPPVDVVRRGAPVWLLAGLPIAIVSVWGLTIRGVHLREMNDLGLVSVLPLSTILLLFALTASFALAVAGRLPQPVLLVHVLALVVMLYGITAFLEPEPRFGAVWKHVGIMDYIEHRGSVDPRIDAYFNWPGFLALGALLTKVAGFETPLAFAAWGPLVFNLLFLAPLVVIFRSVTDDPRLPWLALWVFYSTNWVGQDYISPQAVAYLLWLAIAAVLLTSFMARRQAPASGPLSPSSSPTATPAFAGARHPPAASPYVRGGLLLFVVAAFAATVTGHQLTPVPEILVVTGLVVFAGLEARGLPVLMSLLFVAWVGYMTTAYLSGHIETLIEPLGSVGQNVSENVGNRIGGSPQHAFIVHIRLVTSGVIWALAAIGLARRWRAREPAAALAVLGATPFLLPVLQPYGGEMLLRVFLFALPAVAFFVACVAFPSPHAGRSWLTAGAVAAAGCLLLLGFQYTRYGNERLDSYTTGDVATVRALYKRAPRGSILVAGSSNIPWRYRDYTGYDYRVLTRLDAWKRGGRPAALVHDLRTAYGRRDVYVVVTRSTKIWATLFLGAPGVLDGLVHELRTSPHARELYRNTDGDIFLVRGTRSS